MSFTLADLKKTRSSNLASIIASAEKKEYKDDYEGFWKLERDKAGNGQATIRFLAKHPEDELPFVQMYKHAFKGPTGKWLIDNCLTTIAGDCPVCASNSALWNSGIESDKKIAQSRKRKLEYYSNILVISDPKNPDNEGKVFRFKFGKKIFDKIIDKANPTFADESPVDVFDLWDGADFKLRMCQVEGYPNYDKSTFTDSRAIAKDDDAIMDIMVNVKPLAELVTKDKFKTVDALKKRLEYALSTDTASTETAETTLSKMIEKESSHAPKVSGPKPVKVEAPDDDEDIEDYFSKLAND